MKQLNQIFMSVFLLLTLLIACGEDVDSGSENNAEEESSENKSDSKDDEVAFADIERTTPQEMCQFIEEKGESCSQDYYACEATLDQKFCPDNDAYDTSFNCQGWTTRSHSQDCYCNSFECQNNGDCPEEIIEYINEKEACDMLPQIDWEQLCISAGACSGTPCEEAFNAVLSCLDEVYNSSCTEIAEIMDNESSICSFEYGAYVTCLESNEGNPGIDSCKESGF